MCYSKQLQGQLHSIHKNPVYISELDITATESRFKDQMTQLFILQRAERELAAKEDILNIIILEQTIYQI